MSRSGTGRTEETKIVTKIKPKKTETAKTVSGTGKLRKPPISSSNGDDPTISREVPNKASTKPAVTVDTNENGAREAPKPIDSYTFTAKYAMPFPTQKRGFFKTKTIVDMFKWSLKFVEDQHGIFAVKVVGTLVKGMSPCEGITIVSTIASNMVEDEQGEIYRVIPPFLPELDPIDSVPPNVAAVIKSVGLPADWPLFLRFIWEQRQLGPNKNIPKLTAPPRPARLPPAPVLKAYILSQSSTSPGDKAKSAISDQSTADTDNSDAQKTKKRKRIVLSIDSEGESSEEDSDDFTLGRPAKKPKSKVDPAVPAAKPKRTTAATTRTKKQPAKSKEQKMAENILSENTDGMIPSSASESTATKKRSRPAERKNAEPPAKVIKGKAQTSPSDSRNEADSCILDSDVEGEEALSKSSIAKTKMSAAKKSAPLSPLRTPTKSAKVKTSDDGIPKTPTISDEWTSTQISALEDALMTVDPSDPKYFTSIARKVRGKTIAQIQKRITHMKEEKLEMEQKLNRVPKSRRRPVPDSPLSMDADMSKKKNLKKLEHAEAELLKKKSTDIFDDPHFLKSRGLTPSTLKAAEEEDDAFLDDSDDYSEEDDFLGSIASVRSQVDIVKARMGTGPKKSAKTSSLIAKGKAVKKTASASTSSKSGVSLVSKLLADIEQGKRQVQDAQDEQDEIELEDGIADF